MIRATEASDATSQLRKGVVEFAVLALLESEPMYGWQLSQHLIGRGQFIASIGTLYPVIARLKSKGWVAPHLPSGAGETVRRYYKITSSGRERLAQFRIQWDSFSRSLDDLLETKVT